MNPISTPAFLPKDVFSSYRLNGVQSWREIQSLGKENLLYLLDALESDIKKYRNKLIINDRKNKRCWESIQKAAQTQITLGRLVEAQEYLQIWIVKSPSKPILPNWRSCKHFDEETVWMYYPEICALSLSSTNLRSLTVSFVPIEADYFCLEMGFATGVAPIRLHDNHKLLDGYGVTIGFDWDVLYTREEIAYLHVLLSQADTAEKTLAFTLSSEDTRNSDLLYLRCFFGGIARNQPCVKIDRLMDELRQPKFLEISAV